MNLRCASIANALLLSCALLNAGCDSGRNPAPDLPPRFEHIVVVVGENTDAASVVGNSESLPYLNALISSYGLASEYYANSHPSIGNYMALTTGRVLTTDSNQTPDTFQVTEDNIVRVLNSQDRTWRVYAEDLPSTGYLGGDQAGYAVRHDPFAYFVDVQNSDSQRRKLVDLSGFLDDVRSDSLPDYAFVIPNLCHDAHDCDLKTFDSWLTEYIVPLVADPTFQRSGLLIITFDEGSFSDERHGGGKVATVLVSPRFSRRGYVSTNLYQHENVYRLSMEGLGISGLPDAAAMAQPMWEFFRTPGD